MTIAIQGPAAVTHVIVVKSTPVLGCQVSVVVLTKNAGEQLAGVLTSLTEQIIDCPYEVLVIDSTSSDETIKIAKQFPITIYQIPACEFGHGRTRNISAVLSNGDVLVFISQDALPCSKNWLHEHVKNIKDDCCAGVFGRQIPRPEARPTDEFSYSRDYPDEDFTVDLENAHQYNVIFSDVNAALKRLLLVKFPMPDDIIVCEDVYWASKVIREGYYIKYCSNASVMHSHHYSLRTIFKLSFDEGAGHVGAYSTNRLLGSTSRRRFREKIFHLMRHAQVGWMAYAMVADALRFTGMFLGMHHESLPLPVKRRLSKLDWFWH